MSAPRSETAPFKVEDVHAQFVQVGERQVFLRHAGLGPAVLLLHQSPQSSHALLPWITRLAPHYAVFAPDTPGFGFSDPLPLAQPTIPDLAAALLRLLDALGLQRVMVYGVHTGAVVAARLALDAPDRVAALVCDGLASFNPQERHDLLDGYLPPFEPRWDGTHLLWLWARMREQYLFFPWQINTQAARLAYPLPSPATLMAAVLDVLAAGDDYRKGYRAPFLYEHGAASAARLTVPAWIFYRASDVLASHAQRLPPLPANVHTAVLAGDAAELVQRCDAALASCASTASFTNTSVAVQAAPSPKRRIVPTPEGPVAWWIASGTEVAGAVTHLWIPDIGTPAALPADLIAGQTTWVLELPGHGASLHWRPKLTSPVAPPGAGSDAPVGPSPDALAHTLMQALPVAGVGAMHLHAHGGSCALGAALAKRLGARCVGLSWHDPLPLNSVERDCFVAGLPTLDADAHGTALIAAWNWARLKCLFWPWLTPDAQGAIAAAAPPPRRVHAQVVDMLRAGPWHTALWRAALAVDLRSAQQGLPCPLTVLTSAAPEMQRLAQRLSPLSPGD
jgi:pimeloyl-ACP methyl ester carboxylesterase